MILHTLTDEELMRHAEVSFDSLTGTALEADLLRRFGVLLTERREFASVATLVEGYDLAKAKDIARIEAALKFADDHDVDDVRGLLDVLRDHDIDEPTLLAERLARAAKFESLMDDLSEPLTQLLNSTKEPA